MKVKLLVLAFKAPGGLAPTAPLSRAPCSAPWLIPSVSWSWFMLFLLSRDPHGVGVGSKDGYIYFLKVIMIGIENLESTENIKRRKSPTVPLARDKHC